jgi:anti-sigma regulatory factor (Ser/Thr protein kinase)
VSGVGRGHATLDLPENGAAPGQARRLLADLLVAWHIEDGPLGAGALVVISELVTNAVLHGGGHIVLEVDWDPLWLRLSVSDGSRSVPRRRWPRPLETTGRGLRLVEALSARWGVDSRPVGKRVWAELDLA